MVTNPSHISKDCSSAHRSLIAFTGWGTLAHDAIMAVRAYQLKQLRSEMLPLIAVALLCIGLIALLPGKENLSRHQ